MAVCSTAEAEKLKDEGNTYFKKEKIGAAIEAYTQAITLCPNVHVYWTNRALCHRKRNDWTRVEEDCRRAIHLDHSSVKAHHMLGLALLRKQECAEGIRELERALELGRGANPQSYIVEEIWQDLSKAKYLEWDQASSQRLWELQTVKSACNSALRGKKLLDLSQKMEGLLAEAIDSNSAQLEEERRVLRSFQIEGFLAESIDSNSAQLEVLEQVFRKAEEADVPTEVPDYLCCKITLDIFRDPVITPSGMTYERAAIRNHLEERGNVDPITRDPLHESQLIPNLAIREAVQAFLDKHGWAYKAG